MLIDCTGGYTGGPNGSRILIKAREIPAVLNISIGIAWLMDKTSSCSFFKSRLKINIVSFEYQCLTKSSLSCHFGISCDRNKCMHDLDIFCQFAGRSPMLS